MINTIIPNTEHQFLLYTTPDEEIKVSVFLKDENIWLTQQMIADIFWVAKSTISEHFSNIFWSGELDKNSTVRNFRTVQKEGNREVSRDLEFYNLDAIISVWYRVNSHRATQFRIWATKQLKEFIIKWFVIDDERLKNPNNQFGADYFEQLEERIRDIRSSERRFYQKITDIYATSIDYNKDSELTKTFFATVQNKMHFGIHGKTAAEVIASRVDRNKPSIGLTCVSSKALKKSDIFIAKNYLTESEITELNLIVEQYLAFATLQAKNKKAMTMKDWIIKLDDFLKLNEKEILEHKWTISKQLADEKAEKEYIYFKHNQLKDYESDFDHITKKFLKNKK